MLAPAQTERLISVLKSTPVSPLHSVELGSDSGILGKQKDILAAAQFPNREESASRRIPLPRGGCAAQQPAFPGEDTPGINYRR